MRAAFDAAAVFDRDQLGEGTPDAFNERVVCAHAGLRLSLRELRDLPCLLGTFA